MIGGTGPCETTYAPHSLPIDRAGRPLDSITSKCALKPVNPADYGAPTPDQIARLNAIFPNGVCDWTQPGPSEGRMDPRAINQSYGTGRPLPGSLKRRLGLKLNRYRAPKTKRGVTVVATFTLTPCPRTTWHPIAPRYRVAGGRWEYIPWSAGSRMIRGNKCQASFKLKRVRKTTSFRAYASIFAAGLQAANSPVRTIRIKAARARR